MGYRLIALDIDGTIRDRDYAISERTKNVVARVKAKGALVTLATGRSLSSSLQFATELGLNEPIINSQGTLVSDPVDKRTLWYRPMTTEMAREALEALSNYDLQVLMFFTDEVLVKDMTPWVQGYANRTGAKVRAVGNLARVADEEPMRLVVVGEAMEMDNVSRELKFHLDSSLYITRSLPTFCEILHPEGGKAKALSWLCHWAGVSPEETIAIGNGPDDVDMVRWVGKGVAMKGSHPELLDVADMVALSVQEDGPAKLLERLLEEGLIGR